MPIGNGSGSDAPMERDARTSRLVGEMLDGWASQDVTAEPDWDVDALTRMALHAIDASDAAPPHKASA